MILTNIVSLLILIISAIIVIPLIFLKGFILAKHQFECSHCNKTFYPKWYQVMFETHFNEYFRIKCPYCKKKKYHRIIDGKM